MKALIVRVAIAIAAGGAWISTAHAQAPTCPSGLFGVAAQIVKIEPRDASVELRRDGVKTRTIGQDGVICAGETLRVPENGAVRKIELYVPGGKRVLTPSDTFESHQGPLRFAAQALDWLADAFPQLGSIRPPSDIPRSTAGRGPASTSASFMQIHAMRLLDDLPTQSVAAGVQPVLSWRDGASPYTCQAVSTLGDPIWSGPRVDVESWCAIAPNLEKATQVLVRDSKDQVVSWNVRPVKWTDVPRPDWLPSRDDMLSNADRTAWAFWLWKRPDNGWRLQALGMLNALAGDEWVAGYIRDNLLAESENFKR
jgi:hypothetical protein